MDDTVLFLSAYNSTQYKATNWFLRKLRNVIPHKKKQMQSLLEKHHLSFVATDETITSVDGKMEVTAQYDYVHQATTFSFKSKDSAEKENDASDSLKDSGFYINLRHAQSILVDERYLCMTHWSFRIILKIFQITFANSLIRKRLLNQLRTLVQWKYTNIIHKLVVV